MTLRPDRTFRFSVIIPATRDSSLPAAVRSLATQTFRSWELIVVGQADDRRVRAALDRMSLKPEALRYVRIPRAGLSRARNAGTAVAVGELIAMIDDDCEADPSWLATLDGIFARQPEIDFVGGSMLAPPRSGGSRFGRCPHWDPPEALYDPAATRGRPPDGFGFVGGNFAYRRALIEMVGPFDEHLGVGGTFPAAEDADYLLRMEARQVRMLSTGRAIVFHSDGWRYGLRAVLRHQRCRGIGNGALAAKRAMGGDLRGLDEIRRQTTAAAGAMFRLRRPQGLWYLPHVWLGYRRCRQRYLLDGRGLLRRRPTG